VRVTQQSVTKTQSLARSARFSRWKYVAIQKWGPAYLLILPAMALIAAMMVYPLVQTVIFSLSNVQLPLLNTTFVGWQNFQKVLSDSDTFPLVIRTIEWIVGTVVLRFVLGFVGALIFNAKVKGTVWLRVLVILPWTLPSVVSANLWRWILQSDLGVFDETLRSWHLGFLAQDWLGNPHLALISVILVYSWSGFPFVMLLLLAGLQSIPQEQYEAAQTDGAGRMQIFRHITLPSLRSVITISLILEVIGAVNSFDTIMVMTAGGPANATTIFGIAIYRTGFSSFDFGGASALSVLLLVAALAVFVVYGLINRRAIGEGAKA
jgi:ABC-type sugar transport system permease subunit